VKIYSILIAIIILLTLSLSACQPESGGTIIMTPTTPTLTPIPTAPTPTIPASARLIPTADWLSENQTQEAPDDIVITPGGFAYRANVHEVGVPDKWWSIWPTETVLSIGSDTLRVSFRSYIETKAGEIRNNLIEVSTDNIFTNSRLILYSISRPEGIRLGICDEGGRPGLLQKVIAIDVSPDIPIGEHTFKIGIEYNNKYYGMLSCTINVIE
jgi:hypothetical protein